MKIRHWFLGPRIRKGLRNLGTNPENSFYSIITGDGQGFLLTLSLVLMRVRFLDSNRIT
jgi:hypothetical protein